MVIPLFYYFCQRCKKIKGTKYEFFKQLEDVGVKSTIYKFLNTLVEFGALQLVKDNIYKVDEYNLKKALLSYKEFQQVHWVIEDLSNWIIDFDNLL